MAANALGAEICSRLDALPRAAVRLACRRVPRSVRAGLADEWMAELIAILKSREPLPLTRLLAGTRFALGLVRAAPAVAAELTGRARRPRRRPDWMIAAVPVLAGSCTAAAWRLAGSFTMVMVIPLLLAVPLSALRLAARQRRAERQAGEAVMAVLCQAMEARDFYTRGHCERVSRGSVLLARELGLRAERVEAARRAGLLHDIGKLGIAADVLSKAGPLTEGEFGAIKTHPFRGAELGAEMQLDREIVNAIMHHHERMDGMGYPSGLAGQEIPELARLVTVVDAFDSMTRNRAYRHARRIEDAITQLRAAAGTQFDPDMVAAFTQMLASKGWMPQPAGHATPGWSG
jgi:putative nucleotidyltransferase with HDIG domain